MFLTHAQTHKIWYCSHNKHTRRCSYTHSHKITYLLKQNKEYKSEPKEKNKRKKKINIIQSTHRLSRVREGLFTSTRFFFSFVFVFSCLALFFLSCLTSINLKYSMFSGSLAIELEVRRRWSWIDLRVLRGFCFYFFLLLLLFSYRCEDAEKERKKKKFYFIEIQRENERKWSNNTAFPCVCHFRSFFSFSFFLLINLPN